TRVRNIGRQGTTLDLSGSKTPAGTPILAYPIQRTPKKNQAWLLEYLETPPKAPEPPVPEPPAPEPPAPEPPAPSCDFPETEQQALRGNVVENCVFGFFTSTLTNTARQCYDNIKQFHESNGVQSYVFTSFTHPGGPGGEGEAGECRGYKAFSYHYLVANSSGTAFGGDVALPYDNNPAPEPPPAPSCNFNEADQQAVQGNVVQDCAGEPIVRTVAYSSRGCYGEMENWRGDYPEILSYAFLPDSRPDEAYADCNGYARKSGYYLEANSSGTAIGGDLSEPYESGCDFNKADQQAVRGNVVQDCTGDPVGRLSAHSTQECYDELKDFQFYVPEISSYVFLPDSYPGQKYGDCYAYESKSGHFLEADSSGNAIGGDLSLPVGDVPAPEPPPQRCNFHEGDQQAVRGYVVEDCAHLLYGSTRTLTAKECYDHWKYVQGKYPDAEITSYVFWSALDPGSPNGFGDNGDCRGYKINSGWYFKSNSSGNAFGGDLSVPYEPPGPCEFPEVDQQALRGNVVQECSKWRFANTATRTAQECYDRMKKRAVEWGLESYVFTSALEPGSPDGLGEWSDCTGYQARSYRFFVGNSTTGTSFGGDLSMPYDSSASVAPDDDFGEEL
ncbi:MAG: hypothetical protein Q9183_005515, partial [Haloplaca sp. 2 TL-2023]